jgi:hypothetical protein
VVKYFNPLIERGGKMPWKFSNTHKDVKSRQPVHEAFFDDADNLDDVTSLVRESIQNSIDARVDSEKPVKVSFRLSQLKAGSPGLNEQFAGLDSHMQTTRGISVDDELKQGCRYLVVEDFNTTGLRGYTHNEMPNDATKKTQNFYYFVHAEGDTNKTGGDRGRWGIGKVVFPKISLLKSFFLVSVRAKDDGSVDRVGIGQALLKTHQIDGQEFQPDGWLASYNKDEGYSSLQGEHLESLAKTFQIAREDETGLSVIVPFVNEVITAESIVHSVIREYYLAIINEELVCEVTSEAGEKTVLTPDTLTELVKRLTFAQKEQREEFLTQIDLARKSRSGDVVKFSTSTFKFSGNSLGDLKLSEENLEAARQVFTKDGLLCIDVKLEVPVAFGGIATAVDTYSVLIKRSTASSQPVTYAREGILVPGNSRVKVKFATILVVIDSGPLANLLGFSEGPAHQNWSPDTEKIKAAYSNSHRKVESVIKFVRNTVRPLVSALADPGNELDESVLSEFFSDIAPEGEDKPRNPGPIILPPRQPLYVIASDIKGGFRLSKGDRPLSSGAIVTVQCAYGVARGSAFAKWSPLDFELEDSKFKCTASGVDEVKRLGNVITFKVRNPDFEFRITGFDQIRDVELDIKVREK